MFSEYMFLKEKKKPCMKVLNFSSLKKGKGRSPALVPGVAWMSF